MSERSDRERAFHNEVFSDGSRRTVCGGYYGIQRRASEFYETRLSYECPGKTVLEYGCGLGGHTFLLGEAGATVVGIDISDYAIDRAREEAAARGLERVQFSTMDAENLEFDDDSFDVVYGSSILHHLDLKRAYGEIARVLKPTGRVVFIEPLGHNPLINLYRRMTPHLRTEDERPMLMEDLELAGRFFSHVERHYFSLCVLLAVPLRNWKGRGKLLSILESADQFLFRSVPCSRRYAWRTVLEFSEPLTH